WRPPAVTFFPYTTLFRSVAERCVQTATWCVSFRPSSHESRPDRIDPIRSPLRPVHHGPRKKRLQCDPVAADQQFSLGLDPDSPRMRSRTRPVLQAQGVDSAEFPHVVGYQNDVQRCCVSSGCPRVSMKSAGNLARLSTNVSH